MSVRPLHPKLVASASTSAAATVVVEYFFHLPTAVAVAIVTLITFAAGWFAPERSGE